VNVSTQLTKPKGTNFMYRFAKCSEVTKGFSCFKMFETMTIHVSSQAQIFPEPEHTFKGVSDMIPRQSSQTVHRGTTPLNAPHSDCNWEHSSPPAAHMFRLLPLNSRDIKKKLGGRVKKKALLVTGCGGP
jgi:hypothetical protein